MNEVWRLVYVNHISFQTTRIGRDYEKNKKLGCADMNQDTNFLHALSVLF